MAAGEVIGPQTRGWSRGTTVWNVIGYLLYAAAAAGGVMGVFMSFFFGMATDGCHDSACDSSYHVYPAMLTMWIGVAAVLLLTLVAIVVQSIRGKIVVIWSVLACVGIAGVFLLSVKILH